MWVTEVGWAARGPRDNPYVKGLNGQARVLTRALLGVQAQGAHPQPARRVLVLVARQEGRRDDLRLVRPRRPEDQERRAEARLGGVRQGRARMIGRRLTAGGLAGSLALALLPTAAAAAAARRRGLLRRRPAGAARRRPTTPRMGDAGVGTLRFQLSWAGDRPRPGRGDYDWSSADAIVAGAAAQRGARAAVRARRPGVGARARRPRLRAGRLPGLRAAGPRGARRLARLPRRRGRPLRPGRRVLGREPRRCRGCRSATGRSGTSRTRPATGSRSRT